MRPRFVRRRLVMRCAMPVGGRGELLLDQRPATGVPHDLAVAHAVAGADGLPREMHRPGLVGRPMTGVRPPMLARRRVGVGLARVVACAAGVMAADVDPAMARPRAGHRRERRRRRQLLGLRLRNGRRQVGRRLRGLRHRSARHVLRADWSCGHPERQGCAGKDDDSLHDHFPHFAGARRQANPARG